MAAARTPRAPQGVLDVAERWLSAPTRGLLRHISQRRSAWPGAQKNQYRRLFST
jgi:hypothetical protein